MKPETADVVVAALNVVQQLLALLLKHTDRREGGYEPTPSELDGLRYETELAVLKLRRTLVNAGMSDCLKIDP